ncbi:DNA topoisomerase, putative [Phytophthora infestans T30-4]|uniref:DNA topoisomerase n=1 Tax=Phytophthora infestans (strain T30-4) TaxID=403677 RepID=D0NZ98_PHYIT|nr:DNA topoisomerase, putative [Phytophthora infestans T30-4]EEY68895.1 DNA topoisomerase, putative [Phytophthora infestans T30-4]|eukprot:XP_002997323.1 DNA topoisomerase, putative [Phytophthora infestans T30-4]
MKVLNVAEKPSVAKEIANILSSGRSHRVCRAGFSKYNALFEFPYQVRGQQVQMVVTSVTGHIMELDFDASVRSWHSCDPVDLFTAPVTKKIRSDETQKKIEKTLMEEAKHSQWLVLWLDCDREGENIAYEVKSICEKTNSRLRVFRARFSALIPRDIVHAVQNLSQPNEKLSLAVDARSEIDLRIGAAFTRFQTMRIQSRFPALNQEKNVISYGPCQFPTLGFVVERFLKIRNFEREAFYYISVTHQQTDQPDAPTTTFKWKRGHFFDRMACLCIYESLVESQTAAIESVDKRPSWKRKPLPLTTVELQKRASRWLRISSEATMKAAESLYNKGLISYPRTETSKFKEGTDLMSLVRAHETHQQWGNYVTRQLLDGGKYEAPRHGNSDDQAHPPIHPTKSVDLNTLPDPDEKKVYEFVSLHFLACCSRDAKGSQTSVVMAMLNERFIASGLMVEERNYLDIYKYEKWNASAIPVYKHGDVFRPSTLVMLSGDTNPPPLLSEADLIAKMDSNGIGTDATIAEHIKTILKREYAIKVNNETQFKPTTLGLALVLSYEHMGLELAKPVLRAAVSLIMENDCKAISLGQKALRQVVDSCMAQMKGIFLEVTRSATVLDQTFSEQFGQPVYDTADFRMPPRGEARPRTPVDIEPRHVIRDRRRKRQRLPSRPTDNSAQAQRRILRAPSLTSDIPRCDDHGLPCVEKEVTRDGPNTGRMFYKCSLPQGEQCDFFAWVSDSNAPIVKCPGHNEPCAERTVKKDGPNKGRQFYICRRGQTDNSCGFFLWKDEVTDTPSGSAQASAARGDAGTSSAPKCSGHNTLCAVRKTRKPGPNQYREFYACSFQAPDTCGFVEWMAEMSPSTADRGDSETPMCECKLPGIRLTCKSGVNKGRAFFKCPNPQDSQCEFFQWGT